MKMSPNTRRRNKSQIRHTLKIVFNLEATEFAYIGYITLQSRRFIDLIYEFYTLKPVTAGIVSLTMTNKR